MSEVATEGLSKVVEDSFDSDYNVNNTIDIQNEVSKSTKPTLRKKDGVRKMFDSADDNKGGEESSKKD